MEGKEGKKIRNPEDEITHDSNLIEIVDFSERRLALKINGYVGILAY